MQPINGDFWIFETFLKFHTSDQLIDIVQNVTKIRNHVTTRTPLVFADQNGCKYNIKQLVEKHKTAPSNVIKYALWSLPLQGSIYKLIDI